MKKMTVSTLVVKSEVSMQKSKEHQRKNFRGFILEVPLEGVSKFRRAYDKGDVPLRVFHGTKSTVEWTKPLSSICVDTLLPLLCDGMVESEMPYSYLAMEGCRKLVDEASSRIVNCVPDLILPLKRALYTRRTDAMIAVCELVCRLCTLNESAAKKFVPFLKHLLVLPRVFLGRMQSCDIDYGQSKKDAKHLGSMVDAMLRAIDENGGPEAYVMIKRFAPCYERYGTLSSAGAEFGHGIGVGHGATGGSVGRVGTSIVRSLVESESSDGTSQFAIA